MDRTSILEALIDDALARCPKDSSYIGELSVLLSDIQSTQTADMAIWHTWFQRFREIALNIGSARVASFWQSPSFDASVVDEAGSERGIIRANVTDYKRDKHSIGIAWEDAFARSYIPSYIAVRPVPLCTNSGMAALTVSCLTIRRRVPNNPKIAVGKRSYFENKEMLTRFFSQSDIQYFDESHPDTLRKMNADCVFVDTYTNDPEIVTVDIPLLLSAVRSTGKQTIVCIDATGTSSTYCSIPLWARSGTGMPIIVFESLNKLHQYGLDRVTGGIVWSYGIVSEELYLARDYSGSNMAEFSVAALPSPNKHLHTQYLRILEKNALRIANACADIPGISVSYPGLPSHSSHRIAKKIGFFGPFVSVTMPKGTYQSYRRALNRILSYAKKTNVPLIGGSTFGTPVTRVYTWPTRSEFERPYLRISPGLETDEEIHAICDVLRKAVR